MHFMGYTGQQNLQQEKVASCSKGDQMRPSPRTIFAHSSPTDGQAGQLGPMVSGRCKSQMGSSVCCDTLGYPLPFHASSQQTPRPDTLDEVVPAEGCQAKQTCACMRAHSWIVAAMPCKPSDEKPQSKPPALIRTNSKSLNV